MLEIQTGELACSLISVLIRGINIEDIYTVLYSGFIGTTDRRSWRTIRSVRFNSIFYGMYDDEKAKRDFRTIIRACENLLVT